MKQSPEIDQLATALAAFQAEVTVIIKSHKATIKTKSGADYSYDYADLADTVELAAPKLAAQGLSVTQMPSYWEGVGDVLTTRVMHKSGQWLEDTMRLFLGSDDPRGHGSAITYARRYAYCAALGIVSDKDDDGAAASQAKKPAVPRPPAHPTTRRPPPQVTEITPKRRVLQACGGDMELAERLWNEAHATLDDERRTDLNETELQLLLSRAAAEIKKA